MNLEELQTCRDLLAMLQGENGEVAEYWGKMLAHIDAQAAQIEALKEKLVEATAKQLDVDEPCVGRTHFEYCELMDGSCDGYPHMWEACPRKKFKLAEARQQLAQEMPEVDWK